MKVALDTNRYADFIRGDSAIADILETAEQIILPFIVVAELRAGFALGSRLDANESLLREFLKENDVLMLFADAETLNQYASLNAQLSNAGKRIPTNDLWIAALVHQHNLTLCTRDSHFDHLPQLSRI